MIAGITASTRRFQGGGFVIKTTNGVVAAIEGPGEVPRTGVRVYADGYIDGQSYLEEVISWPEEKPVWLEGNKVSFSGAYHLTKVPDTLPAWITDTSYMFYVCSSFNQDLSGWDTSNVTRMDTMFSDCSIFNQDLSGWDTSRVTNMSSMFSRCSSFNQDLSGWDTSIVTHMSNMFYGCSIFNGDLSGWDTSSVTNMSSLFYDCPNFNQDISGWDTSNVTHMSYMFSGCSSFNQDLSGWCVSNISSEPSNFSYDTPSWSLPKPIWGTCPGGFVIKTTGGVVAKIEGPGEVPGTNIDVSADGYIQGSQLEEVISWPEEKPVWLEGNHISFYGADYLIKVPNSLPAWITDMAYMFGYCSSFNQDLSGWDVSNVTSMTDMFSFCSSFNQDLSGWDVSNVTDMSSMFYGSTSFNQDLSGWDVSNVTSMNRMFYNCSSFNQGLSGWDTGNVSIMAEMFSGCSSFNQDLSGWDVSNVTDMSSMFSFCSSFNQDLSGWCVSNFSSEPSNFSNAATSWTLPKPVWGTCPQEDGGGESEPDLGSGPWDIGPEHPEYFIPGRYVVGGSGSNFLEGMYIGTGSTPEAACNGLRSAMWGQRKEGVHSNQDAHNNRLSGDGEWCSVETIWNDRIINAYIYDGIDAFIASGRDPMSALRYDNGDEE